MQQPVKSIQVHMFGERLYPLGQFKLAETQNGPFEQILTIAKEKNPAAGEEDLVRAIWVQGLHAVVKRLEAGERLESTTGRFSTAPAQAAPSKVGPPPIPTAP